MALRNPKGGAVSKSGLTKAMKGKKAGSRITGRPARGTGRRAGGGGER